jgi:triacylglycerol esterase/lipase EstA (alpha/beta hydrolase family)
MIILKRFLIARGAVAWTGSLARPHEDLTKHAEVLEAKIDALRRATQADEIDLVCHGLGGLAAAWLLRHRDGPHGVRRLVTIGTPWHGTKMAAFLPGRASVEVRPGSHHLDELVPPPLPTVTIWCPDDPDVVPAASAVVDPHTAVAIEGAGHAGLLMSVRSFQAVWHVLQDDRPEAS